MLNVIVATLIDSIIFQGNYDHYCVIEVLHQCQEQNDKNSLNVLASFERV